jgi:hypothetical protein
MDTLAHTPDKTPDRAATSYFASQPASPEEWERAARAEAARRGLPPAA